MKGNGVCRAAVGYAGVCLKRRPEGKAGMGKEEERRVIEKGKKRVKA